MKLEEPTKIYKTTFQHIYFTSGFTISKEIMGTDKDYIPKSSHGCLDSGYFCFEQLKEEKLKGLIKYFYIKTRIYKTYMYLKNYYLGGGL